ncbi:hypothetical protein CsSME_00022049 [Camellia sinensis var. sinensis]|uniref:Glycosyl hydrolase family 32 N-terminal domain-containing protein n=1 Tax=Camellia sinensis TaxID=4442 RepID=A0A7J7GYD8_CAMSI|nr:hypothetical protein HYC85_015605 [Camellia sinensis]
MDAATTRINNVLSLYSSRKSFSSSFLIQQRFPKPNTRIGILFPIKCSTKPGIDSDNATSKNNSSIELNSKPTAQRQASTTLPNEALSSKISEGLVLDLGPKNSWDNAEIGSPVVKRFIGDDEERWYMWYHGRSDDEMISTSSSSDYIGLAVSSNGIHWSRGEGPVRSSGDVGLVMGSRQDWWAFDKDSVRPSELVIMSSPMYSAVYWLYYTGFSSDEVEVDLSESSRTKLKNPVRFYKQENQESGKIFKSLPGLACSQDGRHWAGIEGEHHSGALFDVGSEKDWDSLFIASPKVVMHDNGDLRMYYHSFVIENRCYAIGVARSRDGIRWVKLGKVLEGGQSGGFDELGAMNAHVVRNPRDGTYLMAYEGVDANGGRSIGLAASEDGLKNWVRIQDEAVLRPSEEDYGWDSKGVGSPCLVQMDGNASEWRLYYRGIGQGGKTGIGMAASEGSEIKVFKRWEGFH